MQKAITDAQVIELRERAAKGESDLALAAAFHLSPYTVIGIRKGAARRGVEGPRTKRKCVFVPSERLETLEREVASLREQFADLRAVIESVA